MSSSSRYTGSHRDNRGGAAGSRWTPWQGLRAVWKREPAPAASGRAAAEDFNRGVTLAAVGDEGAAVEAYRRAIRSAAGELAAKAAFNIAVLRGADLAAAAAAYRVAIDSGHEDVAPKAAFNLGLLLEHQGDLVSAEWAFERARGFGHEEVTANAAVKLAQLEAALRASGVASTAALSPRLRPKRTRRRPGVRTGWLATPDGLSRTRQARGHAC